MKIRRWLPCLTAVSVLTAMMTGGCAEQTEDDSQLEATTTETQETGEAPLTTTASSYVETTTPTETAMPEVTSGTTCTTVEANEVVVETLLSEMTLDEKIYQLFIVTPEALTGFNGTVTEAGELTQAALESKPVGGIVYFSQNIETWQQTYEMLESSQQYAQNAHNGIGLFFAVDEEGGSVARVAEKLQAYGSYEMQYYGATLDYDSVYNLGNTIGTTLHNLGFNLDFAPVADVEISTENELGSRIFSSDPEVVSKMTTQFVKGLEETGVSATLKHFPGLGAGTGNTHNGSVVIDRTHTQLTETEFTAFKGGIEAGADFVMVGHQITTAALDGLPGDLSETVVTDWLKGELEFTGIIVTDSQSMGAITENYTPGEAAAQAIEAGVDMILMPYDLSNAVAGVRQAVENGDITEERIDSSVRKILEKKYTLGVIAEENTSTTETTTVQ